MGNWQLEVCKMFLYMAFPVGCFHYFNLPDNFEELVKTARKEKFYMETPESIAKIKKFMNECSRAERLKTIEAMEATDKKFKELQIQKLSGEINSKVK